MTFPLRRYIASALPAILAFLAVLCLAVPQLARAGDERPVRTPHSAFDKHDREDLAAPIREQGEVRIIAGLQTLQEIAEPPGINDTTDDAKRQAVAARQTRVLQRLAGHNLRDVRQLRHHHFIAMTVDADALAALLADPEVTSVSEDRPVYPVLFDTPGITRADKAWAEGARGAGQMVAIIDTGVDKTHPFFSGKVFVEACFSHPVGSNTSYCPLQAPQSIGSGGGPCPDYSVGCWHGTHVAGIATGRSGVLAGTSGIAPDAGIISVQVFQRVCSTCPINTYDSDLLAALDHVYSLRNTYNIASVNMSLGGDLFNSPCDSSFPAFKTIIDNLRAAGIPTVIASGNSSSSNAITHPACISSAISVGATDKQNVVAGFSDSASFLSLLAPGHPITSSVPLAYDSSGFGVASGTSMATPHVAGAWAVLKSARPAATVSAVLGALQSTGIPITDSRNGIAKPLIQIGYDNVTLGALGTLLGHGNVAPTVSITSPVEGATFVAPANVTVTATAADTDGGISKVEFFSGANKITSIVAAPYSFVWSLVPSGSYALTAVATDVLGGTATSLPVNIAVSPAAAGPVGRWRFDEGSGAVAGDSSGNGNNGTLRNGVSWAAGQVGGAIQLNGSTQDVVVADSPSLSITGTGLTLAAWIYPMQATKAGLIHKDLQYSIFRNADGSITYADSATWSYATIGSYGVTPLNTWSHVAVTFDGSVIRFYVNGQPVGTVNRPGALTDTANPVYLGSYAGTSFRFGGKLDEAQIFGRALSAQEIVALQGGGADTTPPSVPVGLSASAVTATGATIFWMASTDNVGVTGYKVYRNGTLLPGTVAVTTFTDTGLTGSTTYSYTVSAFDAAGNNSAPSAGLPVTTNAPPPDATAPSVPVGLAASGITGTAATLSWSASTDNIGVTGYKVFRGGVQVGTVTGTTFTDTGLSASTSYSYKVSAFDAAGNNSAQSSALQVTTSALPQVASSVAGSVPGSVANWQFEEGSGAVAGDSSGNGNNGTLRNGVSWAAGQVGGAIQLDGSTQDVAVADSPSLSITGTGLTLAAWIYPTQATAAGLIHKDLQYSIFRNANGSITYADSATWSYVTIGSYGVTPLNTWSHVAVTFDGSVIRFYVNGQPVGTVNRPGTLTDTANPVYLGSYAGTSLRFGGKLDEVQIFGRALNAQEIVTLQSGVDVTPPSVPVGLAASGITTTAATITWSASTDNVGVTGYKVFRNGTLLPGTVAGTSFADSGLSPLTSYMYAVSAFDAAGNNSALSSALPVTTSALPPVPGSVGSWRFEEGSGGVAGDSSGNGNNGTLRNGVSWAAGQVGGAIQLNGSTQDVVVADSPSLSITGTGLTLAAWIYPTQATAAGLIHKDLQYSIFRNANGSITYADSVTWSYVTIGSYGVTPLNTWSHVAVTFDGSVIRFYVNGQPVGTVNRPGTLAGNANPVYLGSYAGTGFRFGGKLDEAQIFGRALSAQEIAVLADATAPSVPVGLAASGITATAATITWSASTDNVGVTGYKVYRNGTLLPGTVAVTTFTDTGLTGSTTYSYTVSAFDAAGNNSAQSAALSVTTSDTTAPSVPAGLAASGITATTATIMWSASTDNVGVTGYKVYRNGTLLPGTVAVTTFTDTGLTGSTTYSYTVSAFDAAGNDSVQSAPLSVTTSDTTAPSVPVGLAASGITATGATITWSASTDNVGVTGYKVYRNGTLLPGTVALTTFTDTGLTGSTTYNYTVSAFDAAGNNSAQSAPLSVTTSDTTAPSVPVGLAASGITGTGATITWSASTDNVGVTGYKVYRNGTLLPGTVAVTTFTDSGLTGSTTYSYTVSAFDAAGNNSAQSVALSVTTGASTPPAAGLVGSWGFAEGSGAVAGDSSGNGNNGTLRNGVSWAAGQVGGAIQLDGSTQDVAVADSPSLSITGTGLTLAAWIYPTQATAAGLIHKDLQYSIFRNANGSITYADSATWSYVTIGSYGVTPLNTWSHVAVTFDGSVIRFYVNGQPVGTVNRPGTLTDTANPVYLGSYAGTSLRFGGKLDEVQIFGRALNAQEIVTLQSGVDVTPPSVPVGLAASGITTTAATITWSASTDNVGVTGYKVFRNGTLLPGTVAGTSFADSGLSPLTSYMYAVSAFDAAGNNSALSSALPVTTSALPPVPGSVGSWRFEEGSGGVAGDSSGNGNNGTLRNGVSWAAGQVGGAIQLNGSTQDVVVADSPSLSITGTGLTLAAWIYPTQATAAGLIHKDLQYSIFRNANGSITYADSVTWSYVTIGSYGVTPLNTWSHVAVTFDGSVIRFYVNGQPVGTVNRPGTLTDNANPVYLGSYAGTSLRFGGKLDEAQIFGRALSAQEVAIIADATLPSAPVGLAASGITATGATITWSASTDNVGVTGYKVFRDGVQVGTVAVTVTTFTDTGLTGSTTYSYTVSAFDAEGNNSAQSAALPVTTSDTTPPSVPVILGASGITAVAAPLSWSASTDNVGVAGYKVFRNGVQVGTVAGTGTTFIDTGLSASTSYSYTVSASDAAGNDSAPSAALSVTTSATGTPLPTNNDPTNQIRFKTPAEADAKRQALVDFIWASGLPVNTLPAVTTNVGPGVFSGNLNGITSSLVSQVSLLDANVSGFDFHSISYLLRPANTAHADTLVIVHHGHVTDPLSLNIGTTVNVLLQSGFSVAVMEMPIFGWNNDHTANVPGQGTLTYGDSYSGHDDMILDTGPAQGGMGFRLFLEPVVQTINYFKNLTANLGEISMTGLSGGGWTTSLASAIDPRIKLSIPVAGSSPLYLRNPLQVGDEEEIYAPLFAENIGPGGTGGGLATFLEIYALGAYGAGRQQIMITNQFDDCCFYGATFADTFRTIVSDVVDNKLLQGNWTYFLDSLATQHEISNNALSNVIIPALLSMP